MATKPKGGGVKALVAGPLKKELCGFPNKIFFILFSEFQQILRW